MKYIKKENDTIIEAPYIFETNTTTIYGYNKSSNEQMLLKDGFIKYTGTLPLTHLNIINGSIIETPLATNSPKENTIFSKLQIRRAARSIQKEDLLNAILSSNPEIQADWNDAQEIDLNDEMFTNLNEIEEIQDFINELKDILQ